MLTKSLTQRIQDRAYEIFLKRERDGRPGNSEQDWREAEKEIAAEDAKSKSAPAPVATKVEAKPAPKIEPKVEVKAPPKVEPKIEPKAVEVKKPTPAPPPAPAPVKKAPEPVKKVSKK